MKNETVKITVKNNNGEVILKTNNENYKEDLKIHKNVLDLWWMCQVEYDNGKVGFDKPCVYNGRDPRKVLTYNGRRIYAEYNLQIEGHKNVYDDLMKFFDIDFNTKEQPYELEKQDKEYKKFLKETSSPINKKMQPEVVEVPEELKD